MEEGRRIAGPSKVDSGWHGESNESGLFRQNFTNIRLFLPLNR